MTHKEFTEEIEYEEYLGWFDYFSRRPYGWQDDLRAYYIMSTGMSDMKKKPEDIFPSIKQLKLDGADEEDLSKGASTSSLKASPFGALLANAGIS